MASTDIGRFEGKTVIVTGAGSGIGRAITTRVLKEGGRVIASDVSAERLEELAVDLKSERLLTVVSDVTKLEDIQQIIAACDGVVHGLANNAGVMDSFTPIHELTDSEWERVNSINSYGVMAMARAVLPIMLEQGSGSIVNTASAAGLMGGATGAAYTASKHAVVGLTKHAAFMYAEHGIRVNAVAPGAVQTNIDKVYSSEFAHPKFTRYFASLQYPSASPEDLAKSITWLLSEDSTNINGAILPSDGGWAAQ